MTSEHSELSSGLKYEGRNFTHKTDIGCAPTEPLRPENAAFPDGAEAVAQPIAKISDLSDKLSAESVYSLIRATVKALNRPNSGRIQTPELLQLSFALSTEATLMRAINENMTFKQLRMLNHRRHLAIVFLLDTAVSTYGIKLSPVRREVP